MYSIFPFIGINDAELIDENVEYKNSYVLGKTQEKFTEFSGRNFYNNIHSKCNYYTEQQFDASVNDVYGLSVIHFNARSLNAVFLTRKLPRRTRF